MPTYTTLINNQYAQKMQHTQKIENIENMQKHTHTKKKAKKNAKKMLRGKKIRYLREAFQRKSRKYIGLLPIRGTPPSPL